MSIEHDQSQPTLGSETTLDDAVNAARQATQAAQEAGSSDISYTSKDSFRVGLGRTIRESMYTGRVFNSPALEVEHGAESTGTRTTAAHTVLLTRPQPAIGHGHMIEYDVSDRDDYHYSPWVHDKVIPGVPQPKTFGIVRIQDGGTGEIIHERAIIRRETARRLITSIAKQVTRHAEADHSAQFAPKKANPRSQFS